MERVTHKIHPEFPNYIVDEYGNVFVFSWSLLKGDYLRPIASVIKNSGYKDYVISNKDKKRKHKTAHRLVAECFIPNPNNLPEVNHKDGDKLNNHYTNLEWVTHKENQQHAANGDAWKRIKRKDAETIRERYKQGEKQADIAKDYGVHQVTISKVIRERGKSLSKRSRLTDDQISVLRDKSLSGVSTSDLAKEYGISWQSANKLVKNQRRYNAEYAKKLSK